MVARHAASRSATRQTMGFTDAPSFSLNSPATLIRLALTLAVVFVFGGLLGKWLYRDPDAVDDSVDWFALDGAFWVGGAVTVTIVLVMWVALAFLIYLLQRVFHCVFCCQCCVPCAAAAAARKPSTPLEHRRLDVENAAAAASGTLPSIRDIRAVAVRHVPSDPLHYSPYMLPHQSKR